MVSAVWVSLRIYNSVEVTSCEFGEMFCYDEFSCILIWLLFTVVSLRLVGILDYIICKNIG